MPMHDWTRVDAGIYHAFHHEWISEISRALYRGLLLPDYYALLEQQAAGFGPDALTLQDRSNSSTEGSSSTLTRTKPQTNHYAHPPAEYDRRKKSSFVVRHVCGGRIIAMIEILSPGNKNSSHVFHAFIQKVGELLEHRIHLLLIDPFPPGRRDPNGIHAAIWETVDDVPFHLTAEQPITLVAY